MLAPDPWLPRRRRPLLALATILTGGLALRLWGVRWGFPLLFNGDEPHIVDIAVSFGAGSLNPHFFKYPTLWMYVLSVFYGAYYLAWSCFGLRRTVAQFGGLFVWEPWRFYLIGRLLSAPLSCLGVWIVARAENDHRSQTPENDWPWAGSLLAFSPILILSAHAAKPDSLMFFLSALTWLFSLRALRDGRERDAVAAGLCAGLAFAAQYTAFPVLFAPPLAQALRLFSGRENPRRALRLAALSGALSALGFFIGCPYSLIDFAGFRAALSDHAVISTLADKSAAQAVWKNLFQFAGNRSLAVVALPAGIFLLWRRDRSRAALLVAPVLLWAAIMSRLYDGGWARYLIACYPALALLAAEAFAALDGRHALAALAAAGALLPPIWSAAQDDWRMTLPDTRQAATDWIKTNLPPGSGVLLDQPDISPGAAMTREEAAELQKKNAAMGSIRARYYALMRDFHPGGGWRVFRLMRSSEDLSVPPNHLQRVEREGAFVDARGGLGAVRAAGISYVVTSTDGATPQRSPDLALFFHDLSKQGLLLMRFEPDEKTVVGPALQIYRIDPK